MTEEITIESELDSSIELQKVIDSVGDIPTLYNFESKKITIESRIRLFNDTELAFNGCTLTLMKDAPLSTFGQQIPLIAPKYPTSAKNIFIHDANFYGNRDYQSLVPDWNGHTGKEAAKKWGNGYHNTIMLGALNNVKYSNSTNCRFENLGFYDSLGDGIRVEGGQEISIQNIRGSKGGHDIICVAAARNVEVSKVIADAAVNAPVRFRSVVNGKIHDCKLNGNTGIATGPLVQVQNTASGRNCSGVEIYNNEFLQSWGPADWVMGTTGTNDIHIHNNLFYNCGLEPASIKTDDVGGICIDGFNSTIEYNTFVDCRGHGIVFSGWQTSSTLAGLKSTISRNVICGTKESLYKGTSSGTGVTNLTGSRNAVKCLENCSYQNKTNYYGVTVESGYSFNPLLTEDYHLQTESPCRFSGYNLGCYQDSVEPAEETRILVKCNSSQVPEVTKGLTNFKIFKRSG